MADAVVSWLGPISAELFAAWSKLPRRDGVPERRSFDPMTVARILPVVSLIERWGADEWRYRLVGTELDRRWGRRLTGASVLDIVAPALVAPMRRELAELVRRPCGSWSKRRVKFESGRLGTVETLRLPIRAGDGSISLSLCCSGELPNGTAHSIDHGATIVTMLEHRFIDIGAGLDAHSVFVETASAD